jgi:hypothetical protein
LEASSATHAFSRMQMVVASSRVKERYAFGHVLDG